jgi:DNA transformation protein
MAVSDSFRTYVLDQLGRAVGDVRSRAMFGGIGLYSGEFFFALIDDDTLYFKVDDSNRTDFEKRGMKPFQPFGEGGEVMQYYQVAEEILEDLGELKVWVDKSVDVARRRKRPAKKPARRKRK